MADDDAAKGYPLREALERFADPEKWRAFAEVADAEPPRRPSIWLQPRPGWLTQRSAMRKTNVADPERQRARWLQRQRTWAALVADFRAQLVSGELIATGCEAPDSLDRPRRPIPAEMWAKLRIDFRRSSARWHEMRLREILVRRRADADLAPTAAEAAQEAVVVTPTTKQKRPGRRTFMPEAEEEMRALASCNALTGNLKADSHAVAERVAARYPGQNVCCPKTIRNRLNKLYRVLYQEQCARNNSGDF
jgi:hypothetical protein